MKSKFERKFRSYLGTILLLIFMTALTGCKATTDTSEKDTDSSQENVMDEVIDDKDLDTTTNPDNTDSESIDNDATTENTEKKEEYYGTWVIQNVLAYGSAGTYSKEDAESLIGKELILSSTEATYFGDDPSYLEKASTSPTYLESDLTAEDLATNYRITFETLGIDSKSVPQVSVMDKEELVCTFLIKDKNTLIIVGGGTFFQLGKK